MSDANQNESTITARIIRSLQHRNIKSVVIRNLDLNTMTLSDLRKTVEEKLREPVNGFPPPFTKDLNFYDSLKLETDPLANFSKSANALINDSTPVIDFTSSSDKASASLRSLNLSHECEVSVFNLTDYNGYLKNREF